MFFCAPQQSFWWGDTQSISLSPQCSVYGLQRSENILSWKGPTGSSSPTPTGANIPSPCKGFACLWRRKDAALWTLKPRDSSCLSSCRCIQPLESHNSFYYVTNPRKTSYCKAQWLWHQPHRLRITEHPHLDVLTEHEHSQPWIYRGEKKEWSTGGALLPSFFPQNWAVCKNKGQRVITELSHTWDSHQLMFKQDLRTCLYHKGISRPKQSCLLWCLLFHLSKMNYS